MKKPICKKGTNCPEWKKDIFHTVIFMHGPEVCETAAIKSAKERTGKGSPPLKKRTIEAPVDSKIQEFLEQKYLVSFPVDFIRFWNNIKGFRNREGGLCTVFESLKNLRLFGPFEVLAENTEEKKLTHDAEYYLTAHRFPTDLPEMQTLATYDGGRYAYWRDMPKTDDLFIVHVLDNEEHFPKAEIIGDADPRWLIIHICGNKGPKELSPADQKMWASLQKMYQQELKKLVRERNKNSYGEAFHGLGISVEVKGDIGYRPLENPPPTKLKKLIKDFATCKDETKKDKLREEIMNCTTYVDIANDEMDYSLGLEVGHDLFWSNYAVVDRLAEITLCNSYSLLERDAFKTILIAHMKVRRKNKK